MSEHLKVVAKGALIVLIGTVLSKLFAYTHRVILAKGLGPEAYGIFSVCLAVVSILAAIAVFGTPSALERYIPLYNKDKSKTKGLILFVSKYASVFGIILFVLLLIFSKNLADLFQNPGMASTLMIFAIAIPILAVLQISMSISKGFKNIVYPVMANNIIFPLGNLVLTIILIVLGYGLKSIAIAFLVANILAVLFLVFKIHKKLFSITQKVKPVLAHAEILAFSVPLLFVTLFFFVIQWTDTILLAYFLPEQIVGLYNAAVPTASLLYVVPSLLIALLLPVLSELLAKKNGEEISRLFKTVVYWITLANLPVLLFFITAATMILRLLFGEIYTAASTAFIILSLGLFVYSVFLPTITMLQLYKKTKYIFVITAVCALGNVALNILLIPVYGMNGSAIASAISWISISILAVARLFMITRVMPFSWSMIKSMALVLLIFTPLYIVYRTVLTQNLLWVAVSGVLFVIFYLPLSYKFVLTDTDKELLSSLLLKVRGLFKRNHKTRGA
ncbi:MAG: oligosaccharide flippase family protein [Candidatus Nanoarchaeia archaeon]|nr:oligosaccharide flippase family protein [Candidatus Nanoarchaeia archaeon]MDD5239276.1 oligosaccharide flippase family protein [Candidatus Nanoarchaeia archaeon]